MSEFLGDLEELSSWASTTRESLEKQDSGGYNQEVVDPKVCYVKRFFCPKKCFCKKGITTNSLNLRFAARGVKLTTPSILDMSSLRA